jgi:hypothetical protein
MSRAFLFLAATLFATAARAQSPSALAAAEELFRDGRRLAEQGKYAEACPKLAESQKRAPAAGTLMNLADCYEKSGQSASAWITFKEAVRAAQARGRADWANLAASHVADLEPRLSRVTIEVAPEADIAGLEVKRDGELLGRAEWGTAIPLDPGVHVVEASAPGKNAWSARAELRGAGERVVVKIPPLVDQSAMPAARPAEAPPTHGSGQRTTGVILAGAGAASVAFGAVAGLVAMSKRNTAAASCSSYPDHCNSDHSADGPNVQARSWATVSTVAFLVGGAALAAGLVVFLTSPRTKSTGVRIPPGALFLEQRF